MQTGKNAGIETVAALWGYRTREALEAYAPEYLLEKPMELLSLFDGN
jgi:phosphoglycolate phosphatase-like HAD superfamily hydrolase